VQAAQPEQMLTLALPKGVEIASGSATRPAKATDGANRCTVAWRIRVVDDGEHLVTIRSTHGDDVSKRLAFTSARAARRPFVLSLRSDAMSPDKGVVTATVPEPLAEERLVLTVPPSL